MPLPEPSEPSFVAVAMLPPRLAGPDGETLWVRPGMLGEALIPTERRTVLEWLLQPVLRAFNGNAAGPARDPKARP